MYSEVLFTFVINKATDYYRENFGPVFHIKSDREQNTFCFKVYNFEYKDLVDYSRYPRLSKQQGVEKIAYTLHFDFEKDGVKLPTKQVRLVKCVEPAENEPNEVFEVTYTITDIKDYDTYFINCGRTPIYKSTTLCDCGQKLKELLQCGLFGFKYVCVHDTKRLDYYTKRLVISMHKDLQSITNYFIVTNVESCSKVEMLFTCIKTVPVYTNPELVKRTYVLKSIREKI